MSKKLKEYVFEVYYWPPGDDLGWGGEEYYYTKDVIPKPLFSERDCMILAAKIEGLQEGYLESLTTFSIEQVLIDNGIYVKFVSGTDYPLLGE